VLIRGAELLGRDGHWDVRIAQGRIAQIGQGLADGEMIDAGRALLLPGLHDHHIHLTALAAKAASVFCGPPEVMDEAALAVRLSQPGSGWLRGIGYHESVAGILDSAQLDAMAPGRPVRIQHRSGRMWFLNSAALDELLCRAPAPAGLESIDGCYTGRLFDEDAWLRATLGSSPPSLDTVSRSLAAMGITGITDMSPANDPIIAGYFAAEQARGALLQRCLMAGTLALSSYTQSDMLAVGPAKLHLHEAELPDYDAAVAFIADAHRTGRTVAIHCTTETELVFALAALEEAGVLSGDRIEHASIAPDHLIAEIARLGLQVVSQPHFISERGDQYRESVEPEALPWLYRLQAFVGASVVLAGGSDAPFGEPDPWASMAAAVSRRTRSGAILGATEALAPEQALALYLADPVDLARQRHVETGAPADLCLIDRPWREARSDLSAVRVSATLVDGRIVHNGIDEPPVEGRPDIDPAP
jgi:predicted amidohydrolase YtcJ